METIVLKTPSEVTQWRLSLPKDAKIGFVPTMGALHAGHVELLKRSGAENDYSVLSIFVNPTQFNNPDDLANYPKTWNEDLAKAQEQGVHLVWAPEYADLYSDGYRFAVTENELSPLLCGKDRPGHFNGVLTVVMKLLNVVSPTRAYFGEKDFQQLTLVKDMVASFFLPVEVVAVPTVRESDGLALSSRNVRLTHGERVKAPVIYSSIKQAPSAREAQKQIEAAGFKVDYVEERLGRRFAAVRVGEVRLIDNVEI